MKMRWMARRKSSRAVWRISTPTWRYRYFHFFSISIHNLSCVFSSSVVTYPEIFQEIRSVTIAGITGESMAPGQITTFHTSSFPYIDSPIWDVDLAWTPFGRFPARETTENIINQASRHF